MFGMYHAAWCCCLFNIQIPLAKSQSDSDVHHVSDFLETLIIKIFFVNNNNYDMINIDLFAIFGTAVNHMTTNNGDHMHIGKFSDHMVI